MGLRFAILKDVGDVVLQYKEDQLLNRLQARVKENLSETETFIKHRWGKNEVKEALSKAFKELVVEFKEETVKLK